MALALTPVRAEPEPRTSRHASVAANVRAMAGACSGADSKAARTMSVAARWADCATESAAAPAAFRVPKTSADFENAGDDGGMTPVNCATSTGSAGSGMGESKSPRERCSVRKSFSDELPKSA